MKYSYHLTLQETRASYMIFFLPSLWNAVISFVERAWNWSPGRRLVLLPDNWLISEGDSSHFSVLDKIGHVSNFNRVHLLHAFLNLALPGPLYARNQYEDMTKSRLILNESELEMTVETCEVIQSKTCLSSFHDSINQAEKIKGVGSVKAGSSACWNLMNFVHDVLSMMVTSC